MRRLLIVFAATAVLAACGSAAADDREVASLSTTAAGDETTDSSNATDNATDTTGVVDPSEGPLQFAKCMREHGIDMPDPTISENGGGVMVAIGGPGNGSGDASIGRPDPKEMEAANKDCQHFLADATKGFEAPSEEDQKRMQEEALAFSKCMREHGIDMPDPQFAADGGGFNVSIGSPEEGASNDVPPIDFNSDEFKAASEACGQPGGGFAISAEPAGG